MFAVFADGQVAHLRGVKEWEGMDSKKFENRLRKGKIRMLDVLQI